MYRYFGYNDSVLVILVLVVVGFILLIAWIVAISLMCDAVQEKGHHKDGTGSLWAIGILCSPIVLGLYAAALPDRKAFPCKPAPESNAITSGQPSAQIVESNENLPSL